VRRNAPRRGKGNPKSALGYQHVARKRCSMTLTGHSHSGLRPFGQKHGACQMRSTDESDGVIKTSSSRPSQRHFAYERSTLKDRKSSIGSATSSFHCTDIGRSPSIATLAAGPSAQYAASFLSRTKRKKRQPWPTAQDSVVVPTARASQCISRRQFWGSLDAMRKIHDLISHTGHKPCKTRRVARARPAATFRRGSLLRRAAALQPARCSRAPGRRAQSLFAAKR